MESWQIKQALPRLRRSTRTISSVVPIARARSVQASAVLLHDDAGDCTTGLPCRQTGNRLSLLPYVEINDTPEQAERVWELTNIFERFVQRGEPLQADLNHAGSPLPHLREKASNKKLGNLRAASH